VHETGLLRSVVGVRLRTVKWKRATEERGRVRWNRTTALIQERPVVSQGGEVWEGEEFSDLQHFISCRKQLGMWQDA
jgi:hypothetical protein